MHGHWLIILAVLAIGVIALRRQKNIFGQRGIDLFKLKLPILGKLAQKQAIARFTHTLSLLLHSGIPIFQSLQTAIPTLGNKVFIEQLESVHKEVLAGSTLAASLKKAAFIPPFIIHMINVGEAGGRLQEVLDEVTSAYTRESEGIIKIITTLIEPLVILCLGLVLGLVIMAMLLPIFQINMLIG
jgi:type II secretory pathway component PulF